MAGNPYNQYLKGQWSLEVVFCPLWVRFRACIHGNHPVGEPWYLLGSYLMTYPWRGSGDHVDANLAGQGKNKGIVGRRFCMWVSGHFEGLWLHQPCRCGVINVVPEGQKKPRKKVEEKSDAA